MEKEKHDSNTREKGSKKGRKEKGRSVRRNERRGREDKHNSDTRAGGDA